MDLRTLYAPATVGLVLLVCSVVTVAACSTSREEFAREAPPPPAFEEPDAAAPEVPPCQGLSCSRDLKKVLRGCAGSETVVAECGPDQGCGEGACVDACRSAELSKGSVGCTFWTLPPDDPEIGRGACFAAIVANTWDRPVTITAGLGDEPLDVSRSIYTAESQGGKSVYTPVVGPLPSGMVGIVFLSHAVPRIDKDSIACPPGIMPALLEDPIRHGTSITRAFHLQTDAPVSAYSIFPYGGASGLYPTATLLMPTSSWDTSYIAVSPAHIGNASALKPAARTLQIVANEDGTEVEMRPSVDVIGAVDVAGAAKGHPQRWSLARGQVLQVNQVANLSGSPISTNKPVGVFGGSRATFIPANTPYADLTQQQITPFSQWGEYALVPYRPRMNSTSADARELVPWTLVGAVDGTVLEYEPARPFGAPEILMSGQVVTFQTEDLLIVRSQDAAHPFHASVYMTGSLALSGATLMGDPEFVSVAPSDQFLDRYVFFADHSFPETNLTLVRRKTSTGFRPVELECAGEVTGFQPLGTGGEYEYTWLRLTTGAKPQTFAKGSCGYGRHEARSDGPFSVTVWGMGDAASYGYVGGMGSRPINAAKPGPVN